MSVPSYIKLTMSTKTSNYVLPILLEIDNKHLISAKRIIKKNYLGDEKSVNDLIEVEIRMKRDANLLISVSNFLYKWFLFNTHHTIHTSEQILKIHKLTNQDIHKLLENSNDIYIDKLISCN